MRQNIRIDVKTMDDWIYSEKMDDVLEIEMIRIPVNVIISRATSDEYLRHSRKHDFLKVRDIFEEIPSKYVNYSNIGGALCQLRDIRQSAESYRINLKEKKKKKEGKRRDEDLFTDSVDYSETTKFERNEAVDAVFHWTFVSKWKKNRLYRRTRLTSAAIPVPNLSDLPREYFLRNTNRHRK